MVILAFHNNEIQAYLSSVKLYLDSGKLYRISSLATVKIGAEMNETLFSYFNPLAMLGWAALVVYPLAPRYIGILSGLIIPALLSLAYTVLILVHWSGAPGGFDSLLNVMALFTNEGVALAGWAHFLAFDLFLGAWAAKTLRDAGLSHAFALPCLVLTFLFGPSGFLLALTLVGLSRLRGNHTQET